ncbi:hypothetical protein Tco_0414209 [Tanacetum coccineum]
MVPRAVLMKSGLVSINTARQNISKTTISVNTARQVNTAHSKTTMNAARPKLYLSKMAHSTIKRLIHNSNIDQRVNTWAAQGTWMGTCPILPDYERDRWRIMLLWREPQRKEKSQENDLKTGYCLAYKRFFMLVGYKLLEDYIVHEDKDGFKEFKDYLENENTCEDNFALRNFDLEVMEFEYAQSSTTVKLPILKLAQENCTLVTKMSVPVTAEEKTNKKNDVKARSLLLMALPNEHQLTFSQYNDAKTMFAAIETRFGGNEATKKTQKTLLKQQYENFSASSAESLDSIFNRLQKIVIWMNKAEIETMSIDNLYNNFKIVEQKVKKSVSASSGAQKLAFMTASSTISTNDVNTAKPAYEVSTVSSNVNTTSPQVSISSFSDNVVYAFMVENPNGSNLLQQDLEQIHEDDLEAMDLKWQLSLLSMRANRYYQRTGKKSFINSNDIAGKQGNNEDTSSKAMLAIDGVGFDWSDMAEEQCDDLIVKLNQTEFTAATYKRGLATIEEQLITYRKNEVLFSEEVAVLKREVACKDYEINVLKSEFEKVKQEKEGIEFKIKKFDKALKDLDKLLESQITDKSKKGLGGIELVLHLLL